MKTSKKRLGFFLFLIAGCGLITLSLLCSSCKKPVPEPHAIDAQYYPLYAEEPFEMPDTLHYFYNSIDSRGKALSGAEFFVHLKYPVFRSEDPKIMKLVEWLDGQIFVLMYNDYDPKGPAEKRFKANYPAFANYTLNSWLAYKETTYLGCMRESLAVTVALNADVITMKVHHKGYWGGANGNDIVRYNMFDKTYDPINMRSILAPDKIADFNSMLISEYHKNIEPWWDYDEYYKLNPDYMALIPEGLMVIYPGFAHAEGQPTMLVKPKKFVHLLPENFQKIYAKKRNEGGRG